jgi:hypothetical protein
MKVRYGKVVLWWLASRQCQELLSGYGTCSRSSPRLLQGPIDNQYMVSQQMILEHAVLPKSYLASESGEACGWESDPPC